MACHCITPEVTMMDLKMCRLSSAVGGIDSEVYEIKSIMFFS
jgi:hypothetical protein